MTQKNYAPLISTSIDDNGTLSIYADNAILATVENGRDDPDFVDDVLEGMGYRRDNSGRIRKL